MYIYYYMIHAMRSGFIIVSFVKTYFYKITSLNNILFDCYNLYNTSADINRNFNTYWLFLVAFKPSKQKND